MKNGTQSFLMIQLLSTCYHPNHQTPLSHVSTVSPHHPQTKHTDPVPLSLYLAWWRSTDRKLTSLGKNQVPEVFKLIVLCALGGILVILIGHGKNGGQPKSKSENILGDSKWLQAPRRSWLWRQCYGLPSDLLTFQWSCCC